MSVFIGVITLVVGAAIALLAIILSIVYLVSDDE